jgi:hypothetical protein
MTQTLRRELRKKIGERVDAYLEEKNGIIDWDAIYDIAADAALELRGFQFKKPTTIEAAIFAGVPVTEDMLDKGTDVLNEFERVFGFGTLPWYSNTSWDKFAKWVIKAGGSWFADYVAWRHGEGKYKAFSNRKIRENPQAFMDTGYPEYEASKMYRKTDEQQPKYSTEEIAKIQNSIDWSKT